MTNEPTAYRVISEPSGSWHFARTKEDAEKIANNLLKYVNRCKRVRIQALEAELAVAVSLANSRGEEVSDLRDKLAKTWNEGNKQRHRAAVGEAALTFYANPAVYAPHPHGPAFDRRDISYKAKNALAEMNGEDGKMSRPSRADIAASRRLAEHRAANPMTFDGFCKLFNVKPEERVELGFRLAQIRYERTLKACGLDIGYLRER